MTVTKSERTALDHAHRQVLAEAAAVAELEGLLDERLLESAQLIRQRSGKVITSGAGTSGETARRLAHLLSVTGTPALFLHPTDGLHGGLGAIEDVDVVVAISKGGQSGELNEFTRRAKARGAGVLVLTASGASELGALGDVTVVLPAPEEADPGGIVAMGSTLVAAAWGDALAVLLMDLRGYAWRDVLFTHPGGAVGRRAALGEFAVLAPEGDV